MATGVEAMGRLFFDDRVVWAVSILLALALWFQVTGARAQDVQRDFTALPVQWRDLPESMSVLDMQPARVDITLRGFRDVMQNLSREDFIATVSLTGGEPGSIDYYVTVSVPRGVQLVQVAPETVAVTLERSLEELYRVEVNVQGEAIVSLAEPSVDPPQVVVNGPASRVRSVFQVIAEVNVEGVGQAVDERVICTPVDIRGNEVRGVLVTPRQVDIHIPKLATQMSREVPIRPSLMASEDLEIVVLVMEVEPGWTTVTGAEEAVDRLEYVVTESIDMLQLQEQYFDIIDSEDEGEGEDDEPLEIFKDVPLVVPRDERGAEMRIDPLNVTVRLVLDRVDRADPGE